MDHTLLNWLLALPAAGAVLIGLGPAASQVWARTVALVSSVLTFALSLVLWFEFVSGPEMQFEFAVDWIPSLGIAYHVGTDGISVLLVLLTTLLCPLAVLSSFSAVSRSVRGYYACLLLLEAAMIGVFVALDLVLFYLFWEAMLIPMYFLIGIWGGERRRYATIKFVLFTLFGSLLMLVAIVYLAVANFKATGFWNFDLQALSQLQIAYETQVWLFLAFALSFAIKMPLFPFHTWLPDAHVEAPTAGSVILAGVLLKMGVYGFLRFALPWFPLAFVQFAPVLIVLSLMGILYGAIVAMVQRDVKSLVAYSSVAHMGFVMLGICALNLQSLSGSLLQSLNHGVTTGMLFLVVGMIYERRHTRKIDELGGLFAVMPIWTTSLVIASLASIGLPGTNGFVGEFLILLGTFRVHPTAAALATFGIVLAAVYMLWMLQRVIYGKITREENRHLRDASPRERLVLVPLVALIFWMGVYPNAFLGKMTPTLEKLLNDVYVRQTAQLPGRPDLPMAVNDDEP